MKTQSVATYTANEMEAGAVMLKLGREVAKFDGALQGEKGTHWKNAFHYLVTLGCTKDGIEAAEPKLKDRSKSADPMDKKAAVSWASACSTIKQAREFGISLVDTDGSPVPKTDLGKAIAAKKGENVEKATTEKVQSILQDEDKAIVEAAIMRLRNRKDLRAMFAVALKDVARMDLRASPKKPEAAEQVKKAA